LGGGVSSPPAAFWQQPKVGARISPKAETENIKIAKKEIFSWEFFAPFNSLFLEAQNSQKYQQNQKDSRELCLKSILRHSADLIYRFYKT